MGKEALLASNFLIEEGKFGNFSEQQLQSIRKTPVQNSNEQALGYNVSAALSFYSAAPTNLLSNELEIKVVGSRKRKECAHEDESRRKKPKLMDIPTTTAQPPALSISSSSTGTETSLQQQARGVNISQQQSSFLGASVSPPHVPIEVVLKRIHTELNLYDILVRAKRELYEELVQLLPVVSKEYIVYHLIMGNKIDSLLADLKDDVPNHIERLKNSLEYMIAARRAAAILAPSFISTNSILTTSPCSSEQMPQQNQVASSVEISSTGTILGMLSMINRSVSLQSDVSVLNTRVGQVPVYHPIMTNKEINLTDAASVIEQSQTNLRSF